MTIWACVKCGHKIEAAGPEGALPRRADQLENTDCQLCGGLMEKEEPKIDWEGEGKPNPPD